jgi:hypothetical protein
MGHVRGKGEEELAGGNGAGGLLQAIAQELAILPALLFRNSSHAIRQTDQATVQAAPNVTDKGLPIVNWRGICFACTVGHRCDTFYFS